MPEPRSLTERDAQIIWHPYTQHKTAKEPLPVIKGEGVYLIDEKGNKYIDAISSWWTNIHGHAHPSIAEKIYEQARQLQHVIFAGCTHEPAVQLAEKVLEILPGGFSKIFYSDNGSTAVEVAIKMAIQFWKNKAEEITRQQQPKTLNFKPETLNPKPAARNKILAFKNAYHGDTFGAMSISSRGIFTAAFENYLFDVVFIDTPTQQNIQQLKSAIANQRAEIAAFIYEPLVQGAGGMLMYEAALMDELLQVVKSYNIICIADEVMTGFGRTGKLFASDYMQVKPDIICLSKGLTGGTMPLSITACTKKIFDAFLSDDHHKTFFHGHSYTANPLACAAALASLDLLKKEECTLQLDYLTKENQKFVQRLKSNRYNLQTINHRSLGTILAFEIESSENNYLSTVKEKITTAALQLGVLLRPLGNTVYIMPPYCITAAQLQKIYETIEIVLQ